MKKVILILVMALSLNAGSYMCKDSYERFEKYSELFAFAIERDDIKNMKFYNRRMIHYIEMSIANCGPGWDARKEAISIRKEAMKINVLLKKL